MNAFANPEDALHYEFPEFPKPEDQVSEYANFEGSVDYQLKDFITAEPFERGTQSAPMVQPALFQDFKEVFAATQA